MEKTLLRTLSQVLLPANGPARQSDQFIGSSQTIHGRAQKPAAKRQRRIRLSAGHLCRSCSAGPSCRSCSAGPPAEAASPVIPAEAFRSRRSSLQKLLTKHQQKRKMYICCNMLINQQYLGRPSAFFAKVQTESILCTNVLRMFFAAEQPRHPVIAQVLLRLAAW